MSHFLSENYSVTNNKLNVNNQLDKNIKILLIFSSLDMIFVLLLTAFTASYLIPVTLFGAIAVVAAKKRSSHLLNLNFIIALSAIPFRLILIIYYRTTTSRLFGILSFLSLIGVIVYSCITLSLIANDQQNIILDYTIRNPYFNNTTGTTDTTGTNHITHNNYHNINTITNPNSISDKNDSDESDDSDNSDNRDHNFTINNTITNAITIAANNTNSSIIDQNDL